MKCLSFCQSSSNIHKTNPMHDEFMYCADMRPCTLARLYTRVISSTIMFSITNKTWNTMYCGIPTSEVQCIHLTLLHHVALPLHEVSEFKTDLDHRNTTQAYLEGLRKRTRSAQYRLGFFLPEERILVIDCT